MQKEYWLPFQILMFLPWEKRLALNLELNLEPNPIFGPIRIFLEEWSEMKTLGKLKGSSELQGITTLTFKSRIKTENRLQLTSHWTSMQQRQNKVILFLFKVQNSLLTYCPKLQISKLMLRMWSSHCRILDKIWQRQKKQLSKRTKLWNFRKRRLIEWMRLLRGQTILISFLRMITWLKISIRRRLSWF